MVLLSVLFLPSIFRNDNRTPMDYSALIAEVSEGRVKNVTITNGTGEITGELENGTHFSSEGPLELPEADLALLRERGTDIEFHTDKPNLFIQLLPFLLPFGLIFFFFWWMQRRAQGQMSGIMSIGRSKAKTYTTERPSTKFDDIAGYDGSSRRSPRWWISCESPSGSPLSAPESPRVCSSWGLPARARR